MESVAIDNFKDKQIPHACAIPHRANENKDKFDFQKWSEKNEENLPAKEETRTEGTRFQTENVNKERQKGTCSPSCKGQKATFLLITDWVRFGEKQNLKGK